MSGSGGVNRVYRMTWTEYDSGAQRPDGATLHLTLSDAKAMYDKLIASRSATGRVPDEYSQPDQNPHKDIMPMVEVHFEVYQDIIENGGSMWEPVRLGK